MDTWTIDLKKKIAVHDNGLIVFMDHETGRWQAWRSNADSWIKRNFAERSSLVPQLLKGAVEAYEIAENKSKKKIF